VPPLLATEELHTPLTHPVMWGAFVVFVIVASAFDLLLYRRSHGALSTRAALVWSGIWIALALVFNVVVLYTMGREPAEEFLAGYLLEKSLSVDNLFVFVLVFAFFRTPPREQRRVLVWGIIGAMVLRAVMILLGAALIQRFHYTLVFFGVFLVYSGLKLVFHDQDDDPSKSRMIRFFQRVLPLTYDVTTDEDGNEERVLAYRGPHFWVIEDGKRVFTPLFLVLLVVEGSDVVFAVDSVPAIFGVTNDPFIVFTSNMFAILGLRALFFVIAAAIQRLRYLNIGLAIVLSFIGIKMLLPFAGEAYHAWTGQVPEMPLLKSEDRTTYELEDAELEAGETTALLRRPGDALGPLRALTLRAADAEGADAPLEVRVLGLDALPEGLEVGDAPPDDADPVVLGAGALTPAAPEAEEPAGLALDAGAGEVPVFWVRVEGGAARVDEVGVVHGVGLKLTSLYSLIVICTVLGLTAGLSLASGKPPEDPVAAALEQSDAPPEVAGGAEPAGGETGGEPAGEPAAKTTREDEPA